MEFCSLRGQTDPSGWGMEEGRYNVRMAFLLELSEGRRELQTR